MWQHLMWFTPTACCLHFVGVWCVRTVGIPHHMMNHEWWTMNWSTYIWSLAPMQLFACILQWAQTCLRRAQGYVMFCRGLHIKDGKVHLYGPTQAHALVQVKPPPPLTRKPYDLLWTQEVRNLQGCPWELYYHGKCPIGWHGTALFHPIPFKICLENLTFQLSVIG